MNFQNTKSISFNRSTLFSLKAELLKKQEEVLEKKKLPQNNLENFKPPPSQRTQNSSSNGEKKSFKDNLKQVDTEEFEACRKSKAALEKKAELYNHLADSAGSSSLAGRYLVDFDTKKQQEPKPKEPLPMPLHVENIATNHMEYDDDDDLWTEFTDHLGRTRKCLKTDLELYKSKDMKLYQLLNKEKHVDTQETDNCDSDKKASLDKTLLVQKTEDYLQTLRNKWEEKEMELLSKDGDIHYQDVLYDEARVHGVSYYSFSTNEAERRKQMEELTKTRQQTLAAQVEAEERRKKKDELIAARVKAARARQRMRAGLPPEDPDEKKKDFTECLLEFLNEKKNEAESKAKEEEKRIKEEEEKEREKLRQSYIREWDVGKEGVADPKREKFRQMSQEEYVEQQRAKRINEFAPLQTTSKYKNDQYFDEHGKSLDSDTSHVPKTWATVRPEVSNAVSNVDTCFEEEEIGKGMRFTTAKKEKVVKYKNFVPQQDPTLIVNELSDDDGGDDVQKNVKQKRKTESHVEIPPPPTFEYYMPAAKQSRRHVPFTSDLTEAYAQGIKSLEKKKGRSTISEQYHDFIP